MIATLLPVVAVLLWAISVYVHLKVTRYAVRHFRVLPAAAGDPPPVSLLVPLKGTTARLAENIDSFFALDYPELEVCFAIADPLDPAVAVVNAAMARHPHRPARILFCPENRTGNPKFSTLLDPYAQARHDLILICDGNVRMPPPYLRRMVRHLAPDVGILAALPAGTRPEGVAGYLDAVFLNTFYARGTLFCAMIDRPVTPGKAQLFRRSVAETFGGLAHVGRHLGADVRLGKEINAVGYRAVMVADPIAQVNGRVSWAYFWHRHLRWGRTRKLFKLGLFLFEPALCGVGAAALAVVGFTGLFGLPPAAVLAAHVALWLGADWILMRRMDPDLRPVPTLLAWCLRELLHLPIWFHALAGRSVKWAGRKLDLRDNAVITRGD